MLPAIDHVLCAGFFLKSKFQNMLIQFIKNIIGTSITKNEVKRKNNNIITTGKNNPISESTAVDTLKMHPQRYWASPNFFFNSNMFS